MGRPADKDRLKKWFGRIKLAEDAKKKWNEKYRVDELEGLYDGTSHWTPEEEASGKQLYTVNLTFATVETKRPGLLFNRPYARVESRPARSDDPGSTMDRRTILRESTLNTFIAKPEVGFDDATQLALLDADARFGVVEVGYTADFIDNPQSGKPMLKEDGVTPVESEGAQVMQPERMPQSESIYVKRIPAKDFFVSHHGCNRLSDLDWHGYRQWVYTEDIKRNPAYSNTASLKSTGKIAPDYDSSATSGSEDEARAGMSRLWRIWDHRSMKRLVFVEGGEKFLQEKSYKRNPHAVLKFHHALDEFYPIPPLSQLRDPQRAFNWTRTKQMEYLSHNDRKYTYVDGAIDEPELRKLETGGDMAYAKANRENPLMPVPIPPSDRTLQNNVAITKDDYYQISGVTAEQRGVSDAETATQASLVDVNSRMRDNAYRAMVAKWLGEIADLMLRTIQDSMALPYWIQVNVDPLGEGAMQEALNVAAGWQEITSEELGDMCYEVSVDIESLSPVTEDLRRNQWMSLMGLVANPAVALFHLASDDVLKRTLGYHGIRSSKELGTIKQALTAVLVTMMGQQQGTPTPPGQQAPPGPGPLPNGPDMAAQMSAQMA